MEEGRKDDQEKPDWSLLPLATVERVVEVLDHGARKYSRENWRLVPELERRYYAAVLRHLRAWQGGQRLDPDSGLPHLAHAMCSLVFLLTVEEESRPPEEVL